MKTKNSVKKTLPATALKTLKDEELSNVSGGATYNINSVTAS